MFIGKGRREGGRAQRRERREKEKKDRQTRRRKECVLFLSHILLHLRPAEAYQTVGQAAFCPGLFPELGIWRGVTPCAMQEGGPPGRTEAFVWHH